jgi:HJR/Mrr/RecB family endonuclease
LTERAESVPEFNYSAAKLSFEGMDPTDFEELCFELLQVTGYVNVDWRKGTPKASSPSDRGRDIVAQRQQIDADGYQRFETWFIDAKHYSKGVPPEALQGLMTWAEAERPDVALVAASGFLSNPAKDWLASYQQNRHPPFRIRYWERPQISRLLTEHPDLITRHAIFADGMRSIPDIIAAEKEMFDKVWYGRSEKDPASAHPHLGPAMIDKILAAQKRVEDTYGYDEVQPGDQFEWGLLSGKLSTLRWVLGDEWDNLDS